VVSQRGDVSHLLSKGNRSRIKSGTAETDKLPPDTQKSYPRPRPLPVYFLRACSHGLSGGPSLGREQAGLVWGGGVTIRAPDKDPRETAAGSCRSASKTPATVEGSSLNLKFVSVSSLLRTNFRFKK
jgi:hypothetical protein